MRHAKGYTQYAKNVGERYHRVELEILDGQFICAACTYPVRATLAETREYQARERELMERLTQPLAHPAQPERNVR